MKTDNPIRSHHADQSSVDEIKELIRDGWKNPGQTQACCYQLLRLGYLVQDYYQDPAAFPLQDTGVSNEIYIKHIGAMMNVLQSCTEKACSEEDVKLLKNVFTPLSLALKQFKVIDNNGLFHQVNLAWEEFHTVLTSAVSRMESSLVVFPSEIKGPLHTDIPNIQNVADYETAVNQLIANEQTLQYIDRLIHGLDEVIQLKNYQAGMPYEREKYETCEKFINTYRDERYLLLGGQRWKFLLHIGQEDEILKPLRRHKSQVGRLFSSHTPSIVEMVKNILHEIQQFAQPSIAPCPRYSR